MRARSLIIALVALAACSKPNPFFCPGGSSCADAGSGSGTDGSGSGSSCGSDGDCSGATPACDLGTGLCEPCAGSDLGVCGNATPVCSGSDACVACGSDDQCPDHLCLPTGACAGATGVLFVKPAGTADATCAFGDECSLAHALNLVDATHAIIDVEAGTYNLNDTVAINTDVQLVGRGAVLRGSNANAETVQVNGGTVELDFLTISDSNVNDGVTCQNSATLTILEATIVDNAGLGIGANGCDVTVTRSVIAKNADGGITLQSGTFDLENDFIVLNGGAIALNPGVELEQGATGTFAFDTVAYNRMHSASGQDSGVTCANGATAALVESLVTANAQSPGVGAQQNQVTGCSVTAPTFVAIGNPASNDVMFVDIGSGSAAFGDFHLTANTPSTVLDIANNPCTGSDFDGETRPMGSGCDVGADERTEP